jgi:hypothetical protein
VRRGRNNKWVYDLSPQSDGIVSVPLGATTKHFNSIDELREYRNRPGAKEARTLARLKKLGYV